MLTVGLEGSQSETVTLNESGAHKRPSGHLLLNVFASPTLGPYPQAVAPPQAQSSRYNIGQIARVSPPRQHFLGPPLGARGPDAAKGRSFSFASLDDMTLGQQRRKGAWEGDQGPVVYSPRGRSGRLSLSPACAFCFRRVTRSFSSRNRLLPAPKPSVPPRNLLLQRLCSLVLPPPRIHHLTSPWTETALFRRAKSRASSQTAMSSSSTKATP